MLASPWHGSLQSIMDVPHGPTLPRSLPAALCVSLCLWTQRAPGLVISLWHPHTPNYFLTQTVAVHLLHHQAGACRRYSNTSRVLISSNSVFDVCEVQMSLDPATGSQEIPIIP